MSLRSGSRIPFSGLGYVGLPVAVAFAETRAFIHIRDTVRCIQLALENPPTRGERVRILNQMTETHRVRDLAQLVARITGARIEYVANPRKEASENDLHVVNDLFLDLGLEPTTLDDGLLSEVTDVARRYAHRADLDKIPCTSTWTRHQQAGVPTTSVLT